jgi:hypothetical protein
MELSTSANVRGLKLRSRSDKSQNGTCEASRSRLSNRGSPCCHLAERRRFGGQPPEVLEPRRRQLCVPHRVLDVLMAKICLERPRVMPRVGQREPAGMSQHVRVYLDL